MNDAASTKPRRLPLRFSLRVLLIAVTAFAIGFPIWYRWPYEEEQVTYAKNTAGQPDLSRPPDARRVITWQRQWGGGRKQHGEERYYLGRKLVELQTHRDGKRHGPFKQFSLKDGSVRKAGQYTLGRKDGTWQEFGQVARETTRSEFREGKLWRITSISRDGVERHIEFTPDITPFKIIIGGVEIEDRLARLAADKRIDEPRAAKQLAMPTELEFVETPLGDVIDFQSNQHDIPMLVDPYHVDATQPVTDIWMDIPLSTGLTVLTGTRGLACDYRYGCIWITSAEDAENWRDPTGVADIVPPPDSLLATSWNEPVALEVIEQPLADVIDKKLVVLLGISHDLSQITPSNEGDSAHLVTFAAKGMPFKHVLGILLYQTRCRCKLDGETLVILPPE